MTLIIRLALRGIQPPIWRQFTVPSDIRLDQLHTVIQAVMGWKNSHQHQFEAHGFRFSQPTKNSPAVEDERTTLLSKIARKVGDKFTYIYDLGDCWKHDLVVEALEDGSAPIKCRSGARSCPPEDCGGVGGYEELLAVLSDPRHERHGELKGWLGKTFDSEKFNLDSINELLSRYQPRVD